jgi:uncharacterized protein (TIGR02118 family)
MIKLVYCIRRRADLSPEAFHAYWLERHGPLVREVARALRARRYVQSHTLATPANDALRASRGLAEPHDGITELWWESAEELAAATATPEGREAGARLLEDERRFIDFARSSLFVTEEHEIFAR